MHWDQIFTWDNLLQNLVWGGIMSLIGTAIFRGFKWANGHPVQKKREWAFWATGVVGGTFIFALINSGFVSPLVQKLTKPDLSIDALQMSLSDEVTDLKKHYVIFDLTIFNNGAPTVIRSWSLRVSGTDREDIFPQGLIIESQWQTNYSTTGKTYRRNSDSFFAEAGNSPIERGGKRKGFVEFVIPDISRAYLQSHETKYDLTFWDITGRKYKYPDLRLPPPEKKPEKNEPETSKRKK